MFAAINAGASETIFIMHLPFMPTEATSEAQTNTLIVPEISTDKHPSLQFKTS
jgi:hypothetical protein